MRQHFAAPKVLAVEMPPVSAVQYGRQQPSLSTTFEGGIELDLTISLAEAVVCRDRYFSFHSIPSNRELNGSALACR